MPMKRVCAIPTQVHKNDTDYNLSLDLFLSDDGTPTRRMTTFGNLGSMADKAGESEPFLLFTSGVIDFGSSYDDDAVRYTQSNILNGRQIVIGEHFNLTYEGVEITYRVTQILDMQ